MENETIRLNKYIAQSGVCSRREADKLIAEGRIQVNRKVITEMGYQVNPGDTVYYNNKPLSRERLVYVLLNKPKDFITTTSDPHERKTVMKLVDNACDERIYPVGRLDRNTTGLLLLTNDGELSKKLTHPSHEVAKVYQVELDMPIREEDVQRIEAGVKLEDGMIKVDGIAVLDSSARNLGLEIHSGRNRIVRRIFESLGYDVIRLDRVMFAGLTKKDLPRGKWRLLSEKEIIRLKHLK
jgi:23S rRNA pseudouridine2605 synthase